MSGSSLLNGQAKDGGRAGGRGIPRASPKWMPVDYLYFAEVGDVVQKASLNEIDEIIELKLSMFRETGHLDLLADDAKQRIFQKYTDLYKNDEAIHFIVKNGNRIIACCGGFIKSDIPYCFFKRPFYGFIGDVYTIPDERGKGLATELTKATISWLKSKGVMTIRLLAYEQGKPIYQKIGFTCTDEMELTLE